MKNRDIPGLTGLRYIAALMVFVSHYPIPYLGGAFRRMTDSGYIGVTFFFILSGFVLGYNYLDSFESRAPGHTVGYLVARFARVYPLYLFCSLLAWLLQGAHAPMLIHLFALQAWSSDIYTAFGLDAPAWSISVEAFFYVSFPAIVIALHASGLIRTERRIAVCMGAIVAIMLGLAAWFTVTGRADLSMLDPRSAHRWLYRTPLTRALDFILGVLAAAWYLRFSKRLVGRRGWTMAAYLSIALVLAMSAWKPMLFSAFSWDAAYAVPFLVLIVSTAMRQESMLAKFLSSPLMITLGNSSFAFYLIHVLMRAIYAQTPTGLLPELAFYAMFLMLVTLVSIGLHVGIEKPCRNLIRRVFRRRGAESFAVRNDRVATDG